MTSGGENIWFKRFDRHPVLYSYLILALYFVINNLINATSVWMEFNRTPNNTLQLWEPFVWEFTSTIGLLLLVPFVIRVYRCYPPRLTGFGKQILAHLLGSLIFSAGHVSIMVALRKLSYRLADMEYHFGPLVREFIYEYRKDAWGYLFFLGMYQLARFVYRRLKGEASLINEQDAAEAISAIAPPKTPEYFLVKKLDKEFLVKVTDIDWLESSGNYVNLHSRGRIYPLRATLNKTIEQLNGKGFTRIHRSLAVNHNAIESISYQGSGDGEIRLKNGQILALSRRYKEAFRAAFCPE
ncbi:LytTR family DNA-binding domain-containing protein [Chromatiaceae bacterium AAb-1]|nr:LytTR family DNA-binding domain-containing protein [Chromatiaceae bacterium AAb-1]